MRTAVRCTAVVVMVGVLSFQAACSGAGPNPTDSSTKGAMTPTEQLLRRPTAEQAAAMYESQLLKVRAALKKLAPSVEWDDQPPARGGQSLCAPPFSSVRGAISFDYTTGGGGAIPDKDWNEAIEITTEILKAEGYDQVEVVINKPGAHTVVFIGRYGATIDLVGQRSTVIGLNNSGCFLNAEAHQAAKP